MKKSIVLLAPVGLVLLMAFLFRQLSIHLGPHWAVLIGFAFYQAFFCLFFPLLLLDKKEFTSLFRARGTFFQPKNRWLAGLLLLTVLGAIPMFTDYLARHPLSVFLLGIPCAIVNSVCEEVFWRGLFLKTFGNEVRLSVVFPSFLFALWHFSPQMVYLDKPLEEMALLPLLTLPLGLIYALVTWKTGSVQYSAIAHSLSSILAFGVPLSTSLAHILQLPYLR